MKGLKGIEVYSTPFHHLIWFFVFLGQGMAVMAFIRVFGKKKFLDFGGTQKGSLDFAWSDPAWLAVC